MNKQDLDALASLYEGVYSPTESGEYLIEAPQGDVGYRVGRGLVGALRDLPSGLAGQLTGKDNAALQRQRQRGENLKRLVTTGTIDKPAAKPTQSALAGRVGNTTDIATLRRGQEQARQNQLAAASRKPAEKPATKPPSPGPTAKVSPTAPAKPATSSPANATTAQKIQGGMQTYKSQVKSGDVKGAEATGKSTWALANPTLANKPKTPNPLLQDNEISKMKSASVMRQNNMSLPGAKNPTSSDISMSQQKAKADSIVKSGAVAALKPSSPTTPKKPMTQTQSFEWPSAKTIRDIADAYSSIYEGKKKDQDGDKDKDFADVMIARMMASGMSRAEAIAAVKNKEYNEEYELDEATRMRKELGKEGETRVRGELAARSRAYKRSGSVDKTIAAAERGADRPYIKHKRDESDADRKKREEKQSRTLRGLAAARRGSVRDKPRAGMSGYAAKVEGSDKDLQTARQRAMSAGTLTPKEKKQLGEEYAVYEIVASYLLENNFAETIDDANEIIENMSENWLDEILTEKYWIKGAIKEPGAFTKKAKAHGMSTSKFAAHVDKHPEKFSTKTERQANLAQTLRKFK